MVSILTSIRQGLDGETLSLTTTVQILAYTSCRIYLDNFLNKAGPASDEQWVPGQETIQGLESSKVLSVS